jgi:hypothetical protein
VQSGTVPRLHRETKAGGDSCLIEFMVREGAAAVGFI